MNNCISSVESIISVSTSSFRLRCFHSVQFAEVLRHDLFDGTGGVGRALTDGITFQLFLEKCIVSRHIFPLTWENLHQPESSFTFCKLFLMSKETQFTILLQGSILNFPVRGISVSQNLPEIRNIN